MKRRISVSGLLLAGLLITGCNREHKRVIAVIPKGSAHLFWQSVHAGAVKAAREKGVDIVWNGPATETDYGGQLQIVDAMINRHVDAIALAPIDRKAMVRFDNGQVGEVQIWHPDLLRAKEKEGGHKGVELTRSPASMLEAVETRQQDRNDINDRNEV